MEERLQKLLSAAGACSRRAAEGYIRAGRVTVNGLPAQLGQKADPARDRIELDGRPVGAAGEEFVYLMLHKPVGYVTTLSDEQGRPSVADLIRDVGVRVWPVGRLDRNSEGLLLLTNDGELTHRLLHPSFRVEKEYHVWVTGSLERALPILRGPLTLDGQRLAPAQVDVLVDGGTGGKLRFVICQGKKRQVRRMCAAGSLKVTRLQRIREGRLRLGDLKPGAWRFLTPQEIRALQAEPGGQRGDRL
jgi:23S rRNA pseudouridine2605 synthase